MSIPTLIFGTYKKINEQSLQIALEKGFRAFDLASVYNTEDLVLNCIKNNLDHLDHVDREDFYFSYKLDANKLLPEQIDVQVDNILAKMAKVFSDRPYIDMLMIHAPNHKVPIDLTWNKMQELVSIGKVREIGVSNFNIHHLKCMYNMNLKLPAMNQIEINPFFVQKELADFCYANDIKISSYRSATSKATPENIQLLKNIASELNMTPIQVINNWKYTKGYQIVAISQDPIHMEELKVITKLPEDYMEKLDSFDMGELGRSCFGNWSSFDYVGDTWS
jgi:diketogulonate reductase-like aldo/keto reductase